MRFFYVIQSFYLLASAWAASNVTLRIESSNSTLSGSGLGHLNWYKGVDTESVESGGQQNSTFIIDSEGKVCRSSGSVDRCLDIEDNTLIEVYGREVVEPARIVDGYVSINGSTDNFYACSPSPAAPSDDFYTAIGVFSDGASVTNGCQPIKIKAEADSGSSAASASASAPASTSLSASASRSASVSTALSPEASSAAQATSAVSASVSSASPSTASQATQATNAASVMFARRSDFLVMRLYVLTVLAVVGDLLL